MAIVNCRELKGNILDESVVSKIATGMEIFREQIVVQCVVHDDVGVVGVLHDATECDNAWVSGCDLVQTVKGKIQIFWEKGSQEDFMSDNEADVHRLDPLNAHPPRFWGHFDPSREDRSKS